MMRKSLMMFFAIVLCFGQVYAKKAKTVEIKDKIATDSTYSWKMPVPKNWKAKNQDEPSIERLFLQKKNYQVNPYIKEYGGDYTIPRVVVFAQQFNGSLEDFESLLKKSLEEHRTDNEIIAKLGLLKDSDFITSGDVLINGKPAKQVYVKRNYKRLLLIPETGGGVTSDRQEFINDHEVHEIYVIKLGDNILVFQCYSEREFYEPNAIEFQAMIKSLLL